MRRRLVLGVCTAPTISIETRTGNWNARIVFVPCSAPPAPNQ